MTATDAAEDALYGKDKSGDELPDELQRRESRLKKIQQAKAELEREAEEKAALERAATEARQAADREHELRTGKQKRGRKRQPTAPGAAEPEARAQRNFTDPESRIMPDGANKGSFLQGYNAQAAVDSTAQIIVAADLTQQANDSRQLLPMLAGDTYGDTLILFPQEDAMPRKATAKATGVWKKEQGSGVWWIRFRAEGRLKREKAGRKSDAIAFYQQRKSELRAGVK